MPNKTNPRLPHTILYLTSIMMICFLLLPQTSTLAHNGMADRPNSVLLETDDIGVSFEIASGTAAERTSPYVATIVMDAGGATTTEAIVVNVTAADVTTDSTVDYTFSNPTQVTFPIGSSDGATQTVAVVINDDQTPEGDEDFSLTLAISSGTADVGSIGTHTVTIKNNATLQSSLFWSNTNSIIKAGLDGSGDSTIISGILPRYIAVDESNSKIYWADEDAEAIQRADLDGSNLEEVVGGLDAPLGVALDVNTGKVYWSDGTGAISRANLDGSGVEELLTGPEGPPQDIGIDLINNKIYWVDEEVIFRADLADGGNIEEFVFDAAGGIHVDGANNYLYWVGSFDSQIHRTELDTGDDTVLLEDFEVTLDQPRDIFADTNAGKLFWANTGNESLERSNLDGSSKEDLLTFISPPFSVATGGASIVEQTITVEFAQATASGLESIISPTGFITLTTSDNAVTGQSVSVDVSINAGGTTATVTEDYTLATTYTIPAGTAPATLDLTTLTIVNDTVVEANETLALEMSNPSGASLGTQTTLTYTIENEDNYQVNFTEATGTVSEDTSTYTATLTLDTNGTTTVSEVVANVSAVDIETTLGSDYTFTNPTPAAFPIGSTDGVTQTVTVAINDDSIPEDDETFELQLAVNSGPAVTGSTDTQTVTIPSNDVQVEFVSALAGATERDATYNGRVVLRTGGATIAAPVVVDIAAADGSASSPTDYALSTTQVTFPAGSGNMTERLVSVSVVDDQTPEADETFTLSFTHIDGPAAAGDITIQDVTIINNGLLLSKLFTAGNVDAASNVIKSELDGSSPITYTITNGGISDIAVDDVTNTVFRAASTSLYRHDLTTNTETTLTLTGIDTFFGVFDVDPFTERIYLYGKVNAADPTNSIIVTDFSGSFISSDTITGAMTDMAVDPLGGYVYWTASQTLFRLPLAGGTQESYAIDADSITGSFDLDAVNSRLYFTGRVNSGDPSNSIIETDLTGNRISSFTVTGGVSDMAVDPVDGYVYRLAGSTLYRHLISTGSEEVVTIATTPAAQPFQIDISYIDLFVSLAFTATETSGLESVAHPPILTLSTTNDNPTAEQIDVRVNVTGGTATGVDYTLTPITMTIPVGTSPGIIPVSNLSIVDDTAYENPDETLELLIDNGTGFVFGTPVTTTYTILNNDNVPPSLTTTTPADDGTGIAVDTNLTMVFNETVAANTGSILLYRENGATDILIETFDAADIAAGLGTTNVTNDTVTLNPASDLNLSTDYYVLIEATALQDIDANPQPFAGISDPADWNFTTTTEVCGVEAGNSYIMGNVEIAIDEVGLGDIDCLTTVHTNTNHPNATSGLQTGEYWTITAVNGSALPASSYTVTLTITTSFTPDADDKLCRYTGSGWECAASSFNAGQQTITRENITQFSDWAAGNDVGPTVVAVQSFSAGNNIIWRLAGLLLVGLGTVVFFIRRRDRMTNS